MKIKSLTREKFLVPDFNGNLELPENEQIKITYKYLPTISAVRAAIMAGTVEEEHKFCRKYVEKIENLDMDDKPIDTFDKLMNCNETGLLPLLRDIASDLIKVDLFTPGEN